MNFQISENMLTNLNRVSDSALRIEAQNQFKIEYIPLNEIVPSSKNFYAIVEIADLAESILTEGLHHNITLRKISKDNEPNIYEIISGERRYTAFKQLYEKYGDKYKLIPAKVIEVDDVDAEVMLIQSNATGRIITPKETLKQVERLTALYMAKKARGDKFNGRVREVVAHELNMGTTQVAKYQGISRNLDENLLSEVETGDLSINTAAKLAQLPKVEQIEAYHQKEKKKRTPKTNTPNYKYSYVCPSCGAELYSKAIANIRCVDCDEDFILGEL